MKKPNPLLDFVNFEKIKEKNLMDVNLTTLKELYLTDIKVSIFNVYLCIYNLYCKKVNNAETDKSKL